MDREKVIEIFKERICTCSMIGDGFDVTINWKLADDILALLQEQKAVSITTDYVDGFGNRTSHCPLCNSRLVWHQNKNYCGECGRSVKWDD